MVLLGRLLITHEQSLRKLRHCSERSCCAQDVLLQHKGWNGDRIYVRLVVRTRTYPTMLTETVFTFSTLSSTDDRLQSLWALCLNESLWIGGSFDFDALWTTRVRSTPERRLSSIGGRIFSCCLVFVGLTRTGMHTVFGGVLRTPGLSVRFFNRIVLCIDLIR